MRVIGMMSGTSFDAIDAAAVDLEIDGDALQLWPLGTVSQAYEPEVREALLTSLPPRAVTMETICRLDTTIGQAFADLAQRADRDLCAGRAAAVVSHGQTVYHWTDGAQVLGTLQLGQPAWIAERTGLPVVADLRSRDVAAGGQGAPLVSALDVLWLADQAHRAVALNLGGIANLTVVTPGADPVAFDTGPANALIDAAVHKATDGRFGYDTDGELGAAGEVVPDLLARLLAEPYYQRPAPKSTGKELFNLAYLEAATADLPPIATEDLVATLTTLTARTVADAVRSVGAEEVVVAGGGTGNPTLMRMVRDHLPGMTVRTSDELGLPAATKEAYAFAVLGFLTLCGLPSTVPSCTGSRHPSVLGSVTPGTGPLPVLEKVTAPTRLLIHDPPAGPSS